MKRLIQGTVAGLATKPQSLKRHSSICQIYQMTASPEP